MEDGKQQIADVHIAPTLDPVAQDLMPRRFRNWILSDRELSTLGFLNALGAFCIACLGMTFGAWLALKVTLQTANLSEQLLPSYRAYWLVSLVLLVFFLIVSLGVLVWTILDVRRIKRESLQEQRQRALLTGEQ